jgi:hypothetical protein
MEQMKEGDRDQVEQSVCTVGIELGRRTLEEMLTQKAREEDVRDAVSGTCGHALRLVSYREKQVSTIMGPLVIRRASSHCQEPKRLAGSEKSVPACPGVAPFDQRWGLDGHRSSPGVRRLVSVLSARLTHEEVAETVGRWLPLTMSARQVGSVIQPEGSACVRREDQQVQEVLMQGAEKHLRERERREEHGEPIRRLSIEMDGVMARLRRGSVPMEAPEQQREGDVYRDVKVGAVCVGEPGSERSELVPGVFVESPVAMKYVARRTTAEDVAPRMSALARQNGLLRSQHVVVLGDGARWIWNLAQEQFPGALQIVDDYHAREHVWDVARAAFAAEPEVRDSWAHAVIDQLSEGQVEQVSAAREKLPPMTPEPGKTRRIQETEAEYFRTTIHRMRSPAFRAQGIHLGSGIAEAAWKTVVATRAKRSGMRWTPQGLDAILALRTAALHKECDRCWQACREAA